jgi:hypothetical protein
MKVQNTNATNVFYKCYKIIKLLFVLQVENQVFGD